MTWRSLKSYMLCMRVVLSNLVPPNTVLFTFFFTRKLFLDIFFFSFYLSAAFNSQRKIFLIFFLHIKNWVWVFHKNTTKRQKETYVIATKANRNSKEKEEKKQKGNESLRNASQDVGALVQLAKCRLTGMLCDKLIKVKILNWPTTSSTPLRSPLYNFSFL